MRVATTILRVRTLRTMTDYTSPEKDMALVHLRRASIMIVTGYERAFDLLLLDVMMLDVIIGMNELTSFRVVIDCYVYCTSRQRVPNDSSRVTGYLSGELSP